MGLPATQLPCSHSALQNHTELVTNKSYCGNPLCWSIKFSQHQTKKFLNSILSCKKFVSIFLFLSLILPRRFPGLSLQY